MTSTELNQVKQYLQRLQTSIVEGIGQFESKPFLNDSWERAEGGGGCSRVLEEGSLLERGGVNFSHVMATNCPVLPQPAAKAWPVPVSKPWVFRWCFTHATPMCPPYT